MSILIRIFLSFFVTVKCFLLAHHAQLTAVKNANDRSDAFLKLCQYIPPDLLNEYFGSVVADHVGQANIYKKVTGLEDFKITAFTYVRGYKNMNRP